MFEQSSGFLKEHGARALGSTWARHDLADLMVNPARFLHG